jgi:hypothetical protein
MRRQAWIGFMAAEVPTAAVHQVRLGLPGLGPLAMTDDRLVYSREDGTLMAVKLETRVDEWKRGGTRIQCS